ncbi:MAG TPA: flavodoxin family protein [Dehalococcoidia bacterium]|nr:flavodoxin family protein [Dehalococcoidia bacterium]
MEIEILGICGSPIKGGNTEAFLKESLKAAEATGDVRTELITLAGKEIKDCRHCNWCVKKQEEGKFCAQKDDMVEIYPEILKADALLLASPVYVSRLSGYMACFSDRFRVFGIGNVYCRRLRNKVGGALAVAWGRNNGLETTLLSITSTFLVNEMIPVGPPLNLGSPFGATGLASENGTGKFDPEDKLGVLRDEYGVKGARALGKRVAEIAKLIKAGEAELSHLS